MKEEVIRNQYTKGAEKYLYFSAPFVEIYYPRQKILIKNYVLDPDSKIIKF